MPIVSPSIPRTAETSFDRCAEAKPESRPWWARLLGCIFSSRPHARHVAPQRRVHRTDATLAGLTDAEMRIVALRHARAALSFGLAQDLCSARVATRGRALAALPALLENLRRMQGIANSPELGDLRGRLRELLYEAGHLLTPSQCLMLADCCRPIDSSLADACIAWTEVHADVNRWLASKSHNDMGANLRRLVFRATRLTTQLLPSGQCEATHVEALLGRTVLAGATVALCDRQAEALRSRLDRPGLRAAWQTLGTIAAQGLPKTMQWTDCMTALEGLGETVRSWHVAAAALYKALGMAPLEGGAVQARAPLDRRELAVAADLLDKGFGIEVAREPGLPIVALNQLQFHLRTGPSVRRAEITHRTLDEGVTKAIAKDFAQARAATRDSITVSAGVPLGLTAPSEIVVDRTFIEDISRAELYEAGRVALWAGLLDGARPHEEVTENPAAAHGGAQAPGDDDGNVPLTIIVAESHDARPPASAVQPHRLDLDALAGAAWAGHLHAFVAELRSLCGTDADGAARLLAVTALMSQKLTNSAQPAAHPEMRHDWLDMTGRALGSSSGLQVLRYACHPLEQGWLEVSYDLLKEVVNVAAGKRVKPVDPALSRTLLQQRVSVDQKGGAHFDTAPTYGLLLVEAPPSAA